MATVSASCAGRALRTGCNELTVLMLKANLKVNHVGISVPDLNAAVAWYTEHLGFRQLKPNVHHKRDESIERRKDKNFFRSECCSGRQV